MQPISSLTKANAAALRFVLFDIDDTVTTAGKLTAEAYSAMWHLKEAGLSLIPVTGRPAGWCDMILRQWPVAAVIGENGAFTMHFSEEGKPPRMLLHPNAPHDPKEKLLPLQRAVLQRFPLARAAADQFARIYDIAIDFCEDEPKLPLSYAEEIRAFCETMGAEAKVSSIHVNAWYGKYDKRSMAEYYFARILKEEIGETAIFFGDSPNDAPMFARFPLSCGVRNIAPFVGSMSALPRFVTEGCGGAGFAEAAAHILALREER